MWFLEYIQASPHAQNALASALLFVTVVALRWILLRRLSGAAIRSTDLRRRWSVQIRNACLLFLLFGLLVIWATELRTLAISIVAALAAIVLAARELILCVLGSLFKTTAKAFAVGDRIEISGFRGTVVDQTLLSTTLAEIGPGQAAHQHTGRAVVLPNSLFLTTPLVNESFAGNYVLRTLVVPVATEDWRLAEERLLQAARGVCTPYLEEARREIETAGAEKHFEVPAVQPRVVPTIPDPGRVDLVLHFPAPTAQKAKMEQEIVRRYLFSQPEEGA